MNPFIFTTDLYPHVKEIWEEGEGIRSVEVSGAHGIFAARVPFIPKFMTDDFTRRTGTEERNRAIVGRQIRFVSGLCNIADHDATFDLRFISNPEPMAASRSSVSIFLLGKVFHQDERYAQRAARDLWLKVRAHFPSEEPYLYPLEPVMQEAEFFHCYEPVPLLDLKPMQICEIRKYLDYDLFLDEPGFQGLFFPHSFQPNFRFSAFSGLMEALARQNQKCVVSVSLMPTKLYKGEGTEIMQMLNRASTMAEDGLGWKKLEREQRFDDLRSTYFPILDQRHHLFTIKVQIIGEQNAPVEVVHALGSEFMDNTTETAPRLWSAETPGNRQELQTAVNNFKYVEHKLWGRAQLDSRVRRLPFLVSAYEATGAFRLPIPPESGYLPGLIVRDVPFVLPSTAQYSQNGRTLGEPEPTIELGEILHRGTHTETPFRISLQDLARHLLVVGATGSGKTNTCLHLLSQLWREYQIPFLVIYPIDKPDYRLLMADPVVRDDLLIFTLGDETCSPFRFNPFHVPPGILVKTHISHLMRSFEAAFTLWEPLSAVYRDALLQLYKGHGWDVVSGKGGGSGASTPTMGDFYDYLIRAANQLSKNYGSEVKGNVRQAAEIRMRDLLQNAGAVINVTDDVSLTEVLRHPTVMELGRIGSSEDIALIMGFLLTGLVEELQSAQKGLLPFDQNRQHVTLIEEAHQLMSAGHGQSEFRANPRAKGSEDFSNLLAEVRGFGEAIMIAEQIPVSLVPSAIGNTQNKIMHGLHDTPSFNLFCDIQNLDQRQRDYAKALEVGQVVVRDSGGQPVHVQVPNYKDRFQQPDDSDEAVRNFMKGKVALAPYINWQPPLWGVACQWCRVKCQYGSTVSQIPQMVINESARPFGTAASKEDWQEVRKIAQQQLDQANLAPSLDTGYCFLARIAADQRKDGQTNYDAYAHVRMALKNFHETT